MSAMYGHLKISHPKYSGQLRPHEHTSYLPLAVLLLLIGAMMFSFSVKAHADDPPPEASSVALTGSVPGPPPKTAATINSPANNQHFVATPITVTGTCPKDTLVEIYKNNI